MTRYFLLAAVPVIALGVPIGLCALALWAMGHQLHEEET